MTSWAIRAIALVGLAAADTAAALGLDRAVPERWDSVVLATAIVVAIGQGRIFAAAQLVARARRKGSSECP